MGFVNDYSQILNDTQENELNSLITTYERETTNQIAVVIINTIEPYTNAQKYATDLANTWGVGQKGKDNGLMIVVSMSSRQIGIATGQGAEKILTDEICKRAIDSVFVPEFKEGKHYEGIKKGTLYLIDRWGNKK